MFVNKMFEVFPLFMSPSLSVGGGVSAVREGGGGAPGVRQPGPAADRRPMPRHFGTSRQRSGGQLLTHKCTHTHTHTHTHEYEHTNRNVKKLTHTHDSARRVKKQQTFIIQSQTQKHRK